MICNTKIKNQLRYKTNNSEGGEGVENKIQIDFIPFDVKLSFVGMDVDSIATIYPSVKKTEIVQGEEKVVGYDYQELVNALNRIISNNTNVKEIINYYELLQELETRGVSTSKMTTSVDGQSSSRVRISPTEAKKAFEKYQTPNQEVTPTIDNLKFDLKNIRQSVKVLGNKYFQKAKAKLQKKDLAESTVNKQKDPPINQRFGEMFGRSASQVKESEIKEVKDPNVMEWTAPEPFTGYGLQAIANLYNFGTIVPNVLIDSFNSIQSIYRKSSNESKKISTLKKLRIVTNNYHTKEQTPDNLLRRMENAKTAMTKLAILLANTSLKANIIATMIVPNLIIPIHNVASKYHQVVETISPLTSQKLSPDVRNNIVGIFDSRVNSIADKAIKRELLRINDNITEIRQQLLTLDGSAMVISNLTSGAITKVVDPTIAIRAMNRGFVPQAQLDRDNSTIQMYVDRPLTPREKTELDYQAQTDQVNKQRIAEGKKPVVSAKLDRRLRSQLEGRTDAESIQKKLEYTNMLLEFAKQNGIEVKIDTTLQPVTGISEKDIMDRIDVCILGTINDKQRIALYTFIFSQTKASYIDQEGNFEIFMNNQKSPPKNQL